jgi:hypothetical protein
MLPYDLATQEFRVHYAGFFDPGFGYGRDGEIPGTKAVLEVRASEMPILLEDDQFVGRLNYFNMSEKPQKVYGGLIGSNYQQQGLTLSKQFKREPVLSSAGQDFNKTSADKSNAEPSDDAEGSETKPNHAFSRNSFQPSVRARSDRD